MEFLSDYGLFLAKTITFVIAIGAIIVLMVSAGMKGQGAEKGLIEVKKLNDKFNDVLDTIKAAVIDEETRKQQQKEKKKADKEQKKQLKAAAKAKKKPAKASGEGSADSDIADVDAESADCNAESKKRVFVTQFDGDIKASETEELREVITAILSIATPKDEVVIKLESPGGMVHGYGLAASQLARITEKNIPLTICVDKVAASGGYMMACVANKIIAAPFAVIGSIGVVAQIPNFHRLLKKHDVDYEMLTAGEYKRTLTMFGENTDKGREKFVEDLEETHDLFKDFIRQHRSVVDIDKVATGEIWFGTKALEQNLIDAVQTSDAYLFDQRENAELFEISYVHKRTFLEKLGINAEASIERVVNKLWQKATTRYSL